MIIEKSQLDFKDIAASVFREEAEALRALVAQLDDSFAKVCNLILNCKGKTILTGVGKSGHVATKIAASLASTGSPAFFVSAGEAAHGDLGMIGEDDVVIAVSNSGEGSELKVIIPILKRRGIPLIAICGKATSSLGKSADAFLSARVEREAGPLNLAPTSSTTAEMAVGDALVVALVEARGFTKEDFAKSHPGGALGRRLLVHCSDLMHVGERIPVVKEHTTIEESLFEMTKKGLGMVAVLNDEGLLAGIFTDGDLRRALGKGYTMQEPVCKVMTADCQTIEPEAKAAEAIVLMQKKQITSLLVTDSQRRLLGAFNMQDLLKAGIV